MRLSEPLASTKTLRILLAEDSVRYREIYATTIREHLPATVEFADSGEETLRRLRGDSPPDILVLDLELHGMPGDEVLAQLQNSATRRFTPVIVLTGVTDFPTQLRLLNLGADDFIEKGAPPEILIARLRAQIRHKLAVDRLERLALDRDLFAAGVLQDISTSNNVILSLCQATADLIRQDPQLHSAEIVTCLDKLRDHGKRLGAYASDIIQSVRETHRPPKMEPQDVGTLLTWAVSVCEIPAEALTFCGPFLPVLSDKSFLRLAVLSVIQNALRHRRPDQPLTLRVWQATHPSQNQFDRDLVVTFIQDNGIVLSDEELARAFEVWNHQENPNSTPNLGLTLVAKVMDKMQGRVTISRSSSSEAPEGSVVGLILPGVPPTSSPLLP